VWPERDIVQGAEKVDEEAGVGADESESTSSSSSPGRRAWLGGGESDFFLCLSVRVAPPAAGRVAAAAEAACEMAGEFGRCEAARRSDLSSLSPRRRPDMDLISLVRVLVATLPKRTSASIGVWDQHECPLSIAM